MRKTIKRALGALLILVFTVQTSFCADLPTSRRAGLNLPYDEKAEDKLAPQGLFQKVFTPENSEEFRNSILSDVRLITLSFSIAFHFLEDRPKYPNLKGTHDLNTILRNKFRNDKSLIDTLDNNINLIGVRNEGGMVYIPVKRDGKNYEIKICTKKTFNSLGSIESQWCTSPRFAIQAREIKADQDKRRGASSSNDSAVLAKFGETIRGLVAEGRTIIWFTDMDGALTRHGARVSDRTVRNIRCITAQERENFVVITGVGFNSLYRQLLSSSEREAGLADREMDLLNLISGSNNGSELYVYNLKEHGFTRESYVDLREFLGDKYPALVSVLDRCVAETKMKEMLKGVMGWDSFKGKPIDERPNSEHPSQVSLMVLGNEATPEDKDLFAKAEEDPKSPYFKIRERKYLPFLKEAFRAFGMTIETRVSGASSIDITVIDKADAIRRIVARLENIGRMPKKKAPVIIFSGDAFDIDENDEPTIAAADILINVGKAIPPERFRGKKYFSLPDEGPDGLNEFLEAYIMAKFPNPSMSDDEALIGKGFTVEEVNSIKFTTPWQDSEEFRNMVTDVEKILKSATIYSELRASLLKAIVDFKKGRDGRQMGIAPASYANPDRYRMCHGTNRSIGMSPEYFDKNSPFYEHRHQVFVHELFHSIRDKQRDDDDIEPDFHTDVIAAPAHVDAMRFTAELFWGLDKEELTAIQYADATTLKKHPENKLGRLISKWKNEQRNLVELMARDDWKKLHRDIRSLLQKSRRQMAELLDYIKSCDEAASSPENINYPIESRWPILRAVTLLDKREQDKLAEILARSENSGLREIPVIDSILLMEGRVPDDWLEKLYPNLIGRHIWLASSEIWYPGGGLGRVMQFLAKAMQTLLGKYGGQLGTIEPEYQWHRDEKGDLVPMDYKAAKLLTHPVVTELEEVDRFFIPIGDKKIEVVVRRGYNDLGIAAYFIRDREGFYTHSLYNYNDGNHPELPTQEQFTEFISRATLEFTRRQEEKAFNQNPADWKRPILHVNDSQFSLVSSDIMYDSYQDTDGSSKKYADNPLVQKIANAFTTHTYPDRNYGGGQFGLNKLDGAHIPADQRYTFERMEFGGEMVVDFTSNAVRRTRLLGGKVMGVSRNLVKDVARYDDWLDYVKGKIVGVTNGADSAWTAKVFREIASDLAKSPDYKNIFPDENVDYEYMTDRQISATRREAKKRFKLKDGQYFISRAEPDGAILNPDQETVVYLGRLVDWKCGRLRALTDENITRLVERGAQVVIFGNVQHTSSSRMIADGIKALVEKLKDKGPGKLVFVPSFDSTDQQCILATSDMGVVDSNPKREGAGGTETGFMSVGAVVLAPPWPGGEGILVDQGIRFNFNSPGEGNILVPDITIKEEDLIQVSQKDSPLRAAVEKAYLDMVMNYLDLPAGVRNMHSETSLRLDRVLKAYLTAAENLRQYSMMITELEGPMTNMGTGPEETPVATAGTVKNGLEALIKIPEFFTIGVTFEQFAKARLEGKNSVKRTACQDELIEMEREVGAVEVDRTQKAYRYLARSEIRNLSPPMQKPAMSEILAIAGLDERRIKGDREIARIRNEVENIIMRHTLSDETRQYPFIETFANDEGRLFKESGTKATLRTLSKEVFNNTQDLTVADFIDFMLDNPQEFARRFPDEKPDPIIHEHYPRHDVKIIKKVERSPRRTVREDVLTGLGYYLKNPIQFFSGLIKDKRFRDMIPTSVLARLVYNPIDRKGTIPYDRFPTIGSITDTLDKASSLDEGYNIISGGNKEVRGDESVRQGVADLLVHFAPEYAPPEIIKTPEERRMERIHEIDMRLYPSVPDGKTLYRVLQVEHIPISMRSKFIPMVAKLNRDHPELREKIEIVEGKDLIDKVKELVSNPNNIVMTAVADEKYLKDLPVLSEPERLRALVFTGDSQVECILAALRALYLGDAGALRELYELASGNKLTVSDEDILKAINNPQELARKIIFNLRSIRVENQDLQDRLDRRLIELIREAA